MSNPKVTLEKRIQIYNGISVDTVKKKGSSGQKLAVALFDKNRNGVLEGEEAETMNNCTFKNEKGKLTIYNKNVSGVRGQQVTEIKYNTPEDLAASNYLDRAFRQTGKQSIFLAEAWSYEKMTVDLTTNKATVYGTHGTGVQVRNGEMEVKDSEFVCAFVDNATLNIENSKIKNVFSDGKSAIYTDQNSKKPNIIAF